MSDSSLVTLADPPPRMMDASAMDYFLIEMVTTLKSSSAIATARTKNLEQEMIQAGLIPQPSIIPPPLPLKKESTARDSVTSLTSRTGSSAKSPIDEDEEALRVRLESIGTHVGANITERYMVFPYLSFSNAKILFCRLCRDRTMFVDTLDAIKFICKDIWVTCWDKQVDNLRTNHRVSHPSHLSYHTHLHTSNRASTSYKTTNSNP